MNVYIYICMYVQIYLHVSPYMCMYACSNVFTHLHMYVLVHVCMFLYDWIKSNSTKKADLILLLTSYGEAQ